MIRLSNASPAIGTPSVPRMSGRPPAALLDARADRDDGEVAGAAAEVTDQNQLVPFQPGLVGICGRDRLELEDDLVEASELDGRHQSLRRVSDRACVRRIGEMHRPAEHDAPRRRRGQEPSSSPMCLTINAISFSSVYRCDPIDGAVESAVGEIRLERLDEAALGIGLEIALDRRGAGQRR